MNFEVPPPVKIMSALSRRYISRDALTTNALCIWVKKEMRFLVFTVFFYEQVIQKFSEVEQLSFLNEHQISFSFKYNY